MILSRLERSKGRKARRKARRKAGRGKEGARKRSFDYLGKRDGRDGERKARGKEHECGIGVGRRRK